MMENEFYRDEFEQMLKDTTDDFKMYPSRKVWHSIYNDLHPDRKWPSLAVCLLLLTGILYLGVTNNNAINASGKNIAVPSIENSGAISKTEKSVPGNFSLTTLKNNSTENSTAVFIDEPAVTIVNTEKENIENQKPATDALVSNAAVPFSAAPIALQTGDKFAPQAREYAINIAAGQKDNAATAGVSPSASAALKFNAVAIVANEPMPADNGQEIVGPAKPALLSVAEADLKMPGLQHLKWNTNYAARNKTIRLNKFLKGLSTQFYVTPSIGYRVMFKNNDYTDVANNALIAANNIPAMANTPAVEAEPNQQGALSVEAGAGIIKELGKRLRVKTGLQLNYTDFITNAEKLSHPTFTTLVLNDVNNIGVTEVPYSTYYANVPGKNNDKLHNKTIQLSIPVGFDYKLLDAGRLRWYAGASIQTTYVTGGYAYMPSADNNFYVEDESLLRRWNFNAGFETFLSIKTKNKAFINIGPQFRYQLMSTYTNRYIYTEKPYTIGFKVGISTPL